MTDSFWRQEARATVRDVVARVGTDDLDALEAALRDAYPFGPRSHYPYQVWLQERNRVLHGLRRRLNYADYYPRAVFPGMESDDDA